jgi:hypothetical protein
MEDLKPVLLKGGAGITGAITSIKLDVTVLENMALAFGIVAKIFGALVSVAMFISICLTIRRQFAQWLRERRVFRSSTSSTSSSALQLLLLFGLFFLNGCSMLPAERQRSEALKTTEQISTSADRTTERTLTVTPEFAMAVRDSNVVAIPLGPSVTEVVKVSSSTATGAGSRENSQASLAVTIPLGVKLLLVAAGIAALVGVVIWARRAAAGTAFGQGLNLADEILARQIRKLRERVSLSSDDGEQKKVLADIGDLEAERGRLKK